MATQKSVAHAQKALAPIARSLAVKVRGTKTGKPRCSAIAKNGKRCTACPVRGQKLCVLHIPGRAAQLGAKGGRRRAIFNPDGLEPLSMPKSADDVVRLVAHTLLEVRSAKIDCKTATAIFNGCATFMEALEIADLESRLKQLEEARAEEEKPAIQ